MKRKYTVDYFIKKFKAIPSRKWCTQDYVYNNKHCALGHCGARCNHSTNESSALLGLFMDNLGTDVEIVNDFSTPSYKQKTPKARVLAALEDIKALSKQYGKRIC